MGYNDFRLAAVGTWYDNDDGSSRQAELRQCARGEPIEFRREPDNPHDPAAVALVSRRGVKVGYLGRERAGWIASKIDRGYDVRAIVERIKNAHIEAATLGLVVLVNMEGDDPELRTC